MNVHTNATGSQELHRTQPSLIDTILQDVGLISTIANPNCLHSPASVKYVPATDVLRSYPDSTPYDAPWSYRTKTGKLNVHPDIAFTIH